MLSFCRQLLALVVLSLLLQEAELKPRQPRFLDNSTDKIFDFADETSVNSLEEALSVLTNLTSTQKEMWEKQQLREEELREKYRTDQENEAARTKALQEEHRLLNEMKGKISRKLKAMSRSTPTIYSGSDQGSSPSTLRPKDCADLYLDSEETSGVYRVWPTWDRLGKGFLVYCDMDTDGGGWTVIRRWGNSMFSNTFFKKTWNEYRIGFGDIKSDFWLGNSQIYDLTNQVSCELRLDISTAIVNVSTTYTKFWIDSENEKFRMHISDMKPSSTGGDVMDTHDNAPFSTSDSNNVEGTSTARTAYGYREEQKPKCLFGWWFKHDCSISAFLTPHAPSDGPRTREMKIRPTNFLKLKESL